MYTIFKNDISIILTDKRNMLSDDNCYLWIDFNRIEAVNELIFKSEARLYLFDSDLESMWGSFQEMFKVIKASGGIVKNDSDEVLFIFRHDKWDLPKGKIELNESKEEAAIREVEEECGFKNLRLVDYIGTTYHIYTENMEDVLKVSYWYEMYSNDTMLAPQIEEGITDLAWVPKSEVSSVFQNTYPNIALLVGMYWPSVQQ